MIKKYEIITVGADKRIKALRSFRVQDRFVNIGDVGGIVYDENTLSQEGNSWIFSGNLGYPSIRVGGDSIVDTNGYEGQVTDPRPFVNITGTSALIGAHEFITGKTSAAKVLAVGDVEQGQLNSVIGSGYEESKIDSANAIRTKSLIYMGGASVNVTLAGEGYEMRVLRYNAEKKLVSGSAMGNSASTDRACYIGIQIQKTPTAAIVPADITAANVSIPSTAIEAHLDINDSRLEFQYTSAMTVATKVNLANTTLIDVYKSVIDKSNVVISKAGGAAFGAYIYADITRCNVAFTTDSAKSALAGTFENVKNLTYNGSFLDGYSLKLRKNLIVSGCDNFALSTGTLAALGVDAANAANMPFIFIRCNVPNGRFYHNAEIKNTYTDIDFAKASVDLRKTIPGTAYELASSEVEGMYRIYDTVNNTYRCLVEAYDSVAGLTSTGANSYNTTIYKDAKLTGLFNISGTNVFGGTGNHGGGKGCEITNTKETEMIISGNVRVEGNATVKDTRITGTGYFGGSSVTENAYIFGSAYVTDNGVFSPAPEEGKIDSDIHIEDNAKFLATSRAGNTVVYMCGDSEFSGTLAFNTLSLAMYGKSRIAGRVSGRGVLILEDNADTSDKNVEAYGCIRLVGNYRQTKEKIWTGRRTISSENEPTYDNNVKTKHDF